MEISTELALQIIRGAFLPLTCGADMHDQNEKIRLNVVADSNESILRLQGITSEEFNDSDRLDALLARLRADITENLGIQLEPWKMPRIARITTQI